MFYAGSYGGLLTRINRRTGERRAINVWPDNPMGFSSGDITERFQWTYPDRHRADRSRTSSTSTSQHVWKIDQRGPELDSASARSHAPRPVDARAVGRPDHARPDRRRNLRDDLHARAVGRGRQRHLGRLRRRPGARHARRRQELAERHAAGPAAVHAHQPDRSVAARRRHGVPGRQPLSAERPRALRLQDRGLRQDLDEDRQRPAGRRLRARDSRRQEAQGPAVPRHGHRHLRLVRRWRAHGSRCSWICRSRRCTASRSGTTTC